jgi:anti-sigma factor RsiW
MVCDFLEQDVIFMDYIEGNLKPSVRKEFEEHYFICSRCFKKLQVLEDVTHLMRHRGAEIFYSEKLETSP